MTIQFYPTGSTETIECRGHSLKRYPCHDLELIFELHFEGKVSVLMSHLFKSDFYEKYTIASVNNWVIAKEQYLTSCYGEAVKLSIHSVVYVRNNIQENDKLGRAILIVEAEDGTLFKTWLDPHRLVCPNQVRQTLFLYGKDAKRVLEHTHHSYITPDGEF